MGIYIQSFRHMYKFVLFKLLLFSFLTFLFSNLQAQESKYRTLMFQVDSLINVGLPKSALKKIKSIDELTVKDYHGDWKIRAAIYRLKLLKEIESDEVLPVITQLKADIATAAIPEKSILQSLLAEVYWEYYQNNRWEFGTRKVLANAAEDVRFWSLPDIVSEASALYTKSLSNAELLQKTPLYTYTELLEGDTATRFLRPTLYDLLAHRALKFFLSEEPSVTKPEQPFNLDDPLLFTNHHQFASYQIRSTDSTSTFYQGLQILQQVTSFHLQDKNQEALADLDLKRLTFLFDHTRIKEKDSLYLNSLKKLAEDANFNIIKADVLYKIAQYYQRAGDLVAAHSYATGAVNQLRESLGGKNAAELIKEIESRSLSAQVEQYNLPNQNLLASISYRNVKRIEVSIMKLSRMQEKQLQKLESKSNSWNAGEKEQRAVFNFLASVKPTEEISIKLPHFKDFREHRAEFKLSPLLSGKYVALIKDVDSADASLAHLLKFSVTNLSAIVRERADGIKEVMVVHRESGKPLPGVSVSVSSRNWRTDKIERIGSWKTDLQGKVGFEAHNNFDIKVKTGTDSIEVNDLRISNPTISKRQEPLIPKISSILFSDRAIYRPGQTIYFKGLVLSTLLKKSSVAANTRVKVVLNGQGRGVKIAEAEFTSNDFGTFSGSFVIPENTLNGIFYLQALEKRLYLRVEEYKRPTFTVSLKTPKETYRYNDSVRVTGSVKALAGYGLANTKVVYSIVRSNTYGDYRHYAGIINGRLDAELLTIASDTIESNAAGDFLIRFKADIKERERKHLFYTYNISISATSANGETRSTTGSVTVGESVIRVSARLPEEPVLRDSLLVSLSLSNLNGVRQSGKIRAQLFRLINFQQHIRKRHWATPDTILMSEKEFQATTPYYDYATQGSAEFKVDELVMDTTISIGEVQPAYLNLGISTLKTGDYCLKLFAQNAAGDTTSASFNTTLITRLFDRNLKKTEWVIPVNEAGAKTKALDYYVGLGKTAYVFAEIYDGPKIVYSAWLRPDSLSGKITIPQPSIKEFRIQFLSVTQNEIFSWTKKFKVAKPNDNLTIKLVTYRDKLEPGAKEQWQLLITGKGGEAQSAEMLASMYDASLDEFRIPESWQQNLQPFSYEPDYNLWTLQLFKRSVQSRSLAEEGYSAHETFRDYEELEMDVPNPHYIDAMIDWKFQQIFSRAHVKRNNKQSLAIAYKTNRALFKQGFDVVGRVIHSAYAYPWLKIRIEGTNFSTSTDQRGYFKVFVPAGRYLVFECRFFRSQRLLPQKGFPMIVNFGDELQIVDPGVKSIRGNVEIATDGEDKIAIDGPVGEAAPTAQSSIVEDNGVYDMASIKVAPKPLPFMQETAPEKVLTRKNFAETAFFYPQLKTNEKGEILIEFTMPESLTTWKFRAFAHSQDLKTGYTEAEVVTQKKMMISGNMPRFFRTGDVITVQARVVNLSNDNISGKARLEFFDAETGKPLALLGAAGSEKEFKLPAQGMSVVSFSLKIPEGINALTYKLLAQSAQHTDGEENTIPVLSDKLLITESLPMMVRSGESKSFVFERLLNHSNKTVKNLNLSFEYTANSSWAAIKALPYLMEYPYECSEQTFNRYFANQVGVHIINRYPVLKKVFDQWKSSGSQSLLSALEKNKELKSVLIQETPWLRDAQDEKEQQKRIALLFNLNQMNDGIYQNLKALERLQFKDGSFPWFAGSSYSDAYISKYILKGIGELNDLIPNNSLKYLAPRLLKYIDNGLVSSYNNRHKAYSMDVLAWYARSYFRETTITGTLARAQQFFLQSVRKDWLTLGIHEQAMLALTVHRYRDTVLCGEIIKSLEERAVKSSESGWYWAKNKQEIFSNESAIETQALLMKLFSECSKNRLAVDEMKIWLLRSKQVSHWETTKSTAAAIYALLSFGSDDWTKKAAYTIQVGDTIFTNQQSSEAGTGYFKTTWRDNIKPEFARVSIKNKGASPAFAALHWQYLQSAENVSSASAELKLDRKFYMEKKTEKGVVLKEINSSNKPAPGDIIKVVMQITADRDLEYIHLKDSRPSGTEPENTLSKHYYREGLQYYQVTKDASTNFFISHLPKGAYVLEYNLRAVQTGIFDAGIATIQSMYAPEINAHSSGSRVEIR